MDALIVQIKTIVYGIWRKKWYALAAAWMVCAVGWILVSRIPDSYEASARVYVDTNSVLPALIQGPIGPNVYGQVDAMRRTLVSRPNMEKVIRRVDLHLTVDDEIEMDNLILDLQKNINIRSQGPDLFEISFLTNDKNLLDRERAEMARRVVENLVSIFFEANIFGAQNDLREARRFLDEQIADYERQLDEAERRRVAFEQQNVGWLPGENNFISQLTIAKTALYETDDRLQELGLIRRELERQLTGGTSTVKGASVSALTTGPLAERIKAVQQQIDALRLRGFTDKHPDVVAAQAQLDMLMADQEELANDPEAGLGNPIFDEIRIKLVDVETQIASLQGRRVKLERQISDLEGKAKIIPEVEGEMSKLNRDYQILKLKYEQLITSREDARLAQDVDARTDKVNFRIIDPPELPRVPVAPNRVRLLSLIMILGVLSGVGISFVLSQLRTTYLTVDGLRSAFPVPVIGAISAIPSQQKKNRLKLEAACFVVVFMALLLAYGLVMAFEIIQPTSGVI